VESICRFLLTTELIYRCFGGFERMWVVRVLLLHEAIESGAALHI
jgi:hypothetical protein